MISLEQDKRDFTIYLLRKISGLPNQKIETIFNLTYSSVSRRVSDLVSRFQKDKKLLNQYQALKLIIKVTPFACRGEPMCSPNLESTGFNIPVGDSLFARPIFGFCPISENCPVFILSLLCIIRADTQVCPYDGFNLNDSVKMIGHDDLFVKFNVPVLMIQFIPPFNYHLSGIIFFWNNIVSLTY